MHESLIEQAVSDALVEKPIEFTITFKVREKAITKVLKKRSFFKKIYENEEKDVFVTKKESFKIFPPSIGKLALLSKLFLQLEIDFKAFEDDPTTELFRCCSEKTDVMAEIMAVSVLRTKDELLNRELINSKKDFFKWHCDPQHFSIIVGSILTQIDLVNFSNSIRLTRLFRLNENRKKANGENRIEK